jgi:UDP-N-acetylglucosamine 4,6-dehydratase
MAPIDTTQKSNLLVPSNTKRILFFIIADIILSLSTLYVAYILRFNFEIPHEFLEPFFAIASTLIALKLILIYQFKNYTIVWRFYGLTEAKNLFFALLLTYAVFSFILTLVPNLFTPFPRSVVIIDLILSLIFLSGVRLLKRLLSGFRSHAQNVKPTLIVGISSNTSNLIKSTLENHEYYYPIGIIALQEKNHNMIGSYLSNIKISKIEDIADLVQTKKVSAAIIDGALPNKYLREAYQVLSDRGIHDIKRSHFLDDTVNKIESLSIEDLLARHPKDLDSKTIEKFIYGKNILITGAGGSIGSEISVQCQKFGASKLILIDHSEYNLYQIGENLPQATLRLCNILDRISLDVIIGTEKPDIVIHSAAYKHVPLCEANIQSAIMNNVQGSRNVIDSAIIHNVPKIVIISTDKAVRPTNVMGTTKRIVELYAQNVDAKNSEIAAVRFGNVLGSSGSVIPKFKSQIDAGGPITLTHPDITRYFMLISEACQLVLQAAAIAKGKELFILDMGEPVKIIDLARTMIKLYAPGEIEIVTSGLRPGEKLYEELLIGESEKKTSYASIMIAGATSYPIEKLNRDIESLLTTHDPIVLLKNIVPEFTPETQQ